MGHLGALLFLLGGLGALADICEIPEVDSKLVERLGQHLLPWMDRLSLEYLNPSIYVGLRLSSLQAGAREAFYLHNLKLNYQESVLGLPINDDNRNNQAKPSMGQLALYLLAIRANCEFVRGDKGNKLVSQLKRFLEDEKRAIGSNHRGHPRTSYYQYGLGILALCVHQKRLHDSVVGKLLYAVEHDHPPRGRLSVDTVAMAGLAFTCLERSNLNRNQGHRLTLAIRTVQEKILKAQTPEGHFGNVYSTPLALQLLMNSFMPEKKLGTACLKARAALLASMQDGAFKNVLIISQLLPVLNGKSYVDLISPDCEAPRVLLQPAVETPSQTQELISVMLKVPSVLPPYRHAISVPAGSSLEDVLKKAQELTGFTYGTQNSLSGPYLTSVMGREVGERKFWQLLQAPDTPLLEGIADYIPKDGETIELRLVSW
ncbi:transcobalamin-2 [Phoca vitulina]|uniref:transcobalamin-2 n=1 Tax=Phoca vitulina TaxID=9720 RepID=UPI0013961BC1|nr:transcobalamin-2 [Phoca vitulina]XP_032251049.1 transcobalamin-2 [Phoca vitulina]XP_032251050.1 transcobalamin-2 [Phoca vitulina]